MTSKRGQVTVFIIVGILLFLIIAVLYYSFNRGLQTGSYDEILIDTSSLSSFVTSCAKQTAQDAVIYTGKRGGVYIGFFGETLTPYPVPYHHDLGVNIPYYLNEGILFFPTTDIIQQTLARYVEDELDACTNDFEVFRDQSYTIEDGAVTAKALIAENQVVFEIEYPVTLVKGDSRDSVSRFTTEVDIDLPRIINAAESYVEVQKEVPESILVGELIKSSGNNNLMSVILNKGDGISIVSFVDMDIVINQEPFVWSFAVKTVQ